MNPGKLIAKVRRRLKRQRLRINREVLWAQVFRDTTRNSDWLLKKSFSPGRWAAGYPMLYILYRTLNDTEPSSILELGLGESTKITYQYEKSHGDTKLQVIEQDDAWLEFFSRRTFPVGQITTICPLVKVKVKGHMVFAYDGLQNAVGDKKYDLVICDGPWGSPRYSRYQLTDIVLNNIDYDNFVILLDDCERKGEKDTLKEVRKILDSSGIKYKTGVYRGEKDTVVFCSADKGFLTSL